MSNISSYHIKKATENLIKKYAKQHKKNGTHKWEKLGQEIEKLKNSFLCDNNFSDFNQMVKTKELVERTVDKIYDKYFKEGNFYNHIHGNSKFKELINILK